MLSLFLWKTVTIKLHLSTLNHLCEKMLPVYWRLHLVLFTFFYSVYTHMFPSFGDSSFSSAEWAMLFDFQCIKEQNRCWPSWKQTLGMFFACRLVLGCREVFFNMLNKQARVCFFLGGGGIIQFKVIITENTHENTETRRDSIHKG